MLSLDHCPKCQSNHIVKAGFVSGKQRYRCKDCIHHFTVLRKSTKKDDEVKKMAVDMYHHNNPISDRRAGREQLITFAI